MSYIRFKGSNEVLPCSVVPSGNVVTLSFPAEPVVSTKGFEVFLDENCEMRIGNYLAYTTIYRNDETTESCNSYQLSNDGSVYLAPPDPQPVPDPEPYVPTLEELREAKVAEMNAMQQAAIQSGINVTLTDGTMEHFTLTDHDQTSLMGLQSQVLSGEQSIPWHTSDEAEHCKFYSNADMALITASAMACVTWHVTYFRDLRIYIRSLETKEDVEAVTYGMEIPAAYRSEPLQAMLAAQNA